MLTDKELDEPNKVRAAKCPICKGNILICGIDHLDGKTIKEFERYKTKYNCEVTHITIREARMQEMCFKPNACNSLF